MNDNLPPLPPCAPEFKPRWATDPGGYNEEQMQAYARAAIERQSAQDNNDIHSPFNACMHREFCRSLAAAPQPEQEPVAWRILDKDPLGCGDDRWVVYTQDDFKPGVCPTDYFNIEPLYTSPQAQPAQPLSDELIEEAAPVSAEHAHSFKRGVRFAETKHSIPKGTT